MLYNNHIHTATIEQAGLEDIPLVEQRGWYLYVETVQVKGIIIYE